MKRNIRCVTCSLLLLMISQLSYALSKQQWEGWRVYQYQDENEGNRQIKAVLYAVEGEDSALGIRCENNQPELYIILSDNLANNATAALQLQVDGHKIPHGQWVRSSAKNGAFSQQPLLLLSMLEYKKSLIITYQTEQKRYKVTGFQLDGIDQMMAQFNMVCPN